MNAPPRCSAWRVALLAPLLGCTTPAPPDVVDTDPQVAADPTEAALRALVADGTIVALPPRPPASAPLLALGRSLYADPLLYAQRDASCYGCHGTWSSYGHATPLSLHTDRSVAPRRVPNVSDIGRVPLPTWFWDLTVTTSGDGVAMPHAALLPQGADTLTAAMLLELVDRHDGPVSDDQARARLDGLRADLAAVPAYVAAFDAAFPGRAAGAPTLPEVLTALGAWMIDVNASRRSDFDDWIGGDEEAISERAKRGALRFFGASGCAGCHPAPAFTDAKAHALGTPQVATTANGGDRGTGARGGPDWAFRTPTLRNVTLSPPYLHDGLVLRVADAVAWHIDPDAAWRAFDIAKVPPSITGATKGGSKLVHLVDPFADTGPLPRAARDAALGEARAVDPVELEELVAFLTTLKDRSWLSRAMAAPPGVLSGRNMGDVLPYR